MSRNLPLAIGALVLTVAVIGWLLRDQPYTWDIDASQPPPAVPAGNPMMIDKVELGRWLFYDVRLSINNTMSCASCHLQALAFTDGRARAVGATGVVHPRGSMTLVNVAYASRLTWANQLLDKLEDQALTPLFGDKPVEMGMAGRDEEIVELLRHDARYAELVQKAFPQEDDPYSIVSVVRAIAAFVRSIVSYSSPYDNYLRGDPTAISESAARGMELFFSERLECFHCHGGFNFTDSTTHANSRIDRIGYHNTGLYNLDGEGQFPADNTGLFDMTGKRRDMGRFKAPTLRNIAVTAPYMHDGSIATLGEVIAHYARGGRLIEEGPNAGDGRRSPFKSEFVRGFELTDSELADLIAFLESLTDQRVLSDPRWSDPFRGTGPATP
jgi:cytochrome c peroxidase